LVRKHPDKKHLITDILIGNLFKDEVDELWPLIDALRDEEAAMSGSMSSAAMSSGGKEPMPVGS
jgi:hypothetical protein